MRTATFDNLNENAVAQIILEATLEDSDETLIDRVLREVKEEKEDGILLLYSDVASHTISYKGLGRLFKLDGLVRILNDYLLDRKLDLRARSFKLRDIDCIKIEKFTRLNIVSKIEKKEDVGTGVIDMNDEKCKGIFKDKEVEKDVE